ncbi:MAG: Bug family tripartite tricarboxylate transporter substrate binding protein [Burkholderiales bacterium]
MPEMRKPPSRRRALATMAGLGLAASSRLGAQSPTAKWPVGTVRFIVPAPPGGGVDAFCRRLGDRLAAHLGTNVVIDNRSGAGGMIGAQALNTAVADGSNIGYLHYGHMTLQAMGAKIDLSRDFTPLVPRFSVSQFVIAVHAEAPYKTLSDLTRAILAQPGKLNWGSGGIGTPGQMTFESLRLRTPGLDAQYVPYKGAIDAANAVAAKNLDFVSGLVSAVLPHLKGGRLRGLGVSGATRSAQLPDVPTIAEGGFPGFSLVSWGGIYAPPRLPAELAATLRATLTRIGTEPEFRSFLEAMSSEIHATDTPEGFAAYFKTALARETELVKKLDLKLP